MSDQPRLPWWRTRGGIAAIGFALVVALFVLREHSAHALGLLPYLLLLACAVRRGAALGQLRAVGHRTGAGTHLVKDIRLGAAMRRGQLHYSDLAIATVLTLRVVFRPALRQIEGLISSILHLVGLGHAAWFGHSHGLLSGASG